VLHLRTGERRTAHNSLPIWGSRPWNHVDDSGKGSGMVKARSAGAGHIRGLSRLEPEAGRLFEAKGHRTLSKSAHPKEAETYMMEETVCREPNSVSDLAATTRSFSQMETGVPA